MRIQKAIFLFFFSFLSSFANADMFVNFLDLPQKGTTKGAAGMLISSEIEMQRDNNRNVADLERQSVVLSGIHGMSNNSGVFGGLAHITDGEWGSGDMEGNSYFGGAYGEVDLIQGTKVLAYGQYKSFDEEFDNGNNNEDVSGSEINVGLIGIFKQESGVSFYLGPDYVVSTDIEDDDNDVYERQKKFGIRAGFNYPMQGKSMNFYGTAGFMNEQSFFLGVSKDFK